MEMIAIKFIPTWAWNINDIKMFKKIEQTCVKPLVHVCSGASDVGDVRVDAYMVNKNGEYIHRPCEKKYMSHPNVLGDMNRLPIKSDSVNTVICDPPYDYKYTKDNKLINELGRILSIGGLLYFYAPWVPYTYSLSVINIQHYKVSKNSPYFKLLSVSKKTGRDLLFLMDILDEEISHRGIKND